jgi:hypothetical protein
MSRAGAPTWPIAPPRGRARGGVHLARVSLSITVFAVCCASCLVTSVPDFGDPEQTPPELIAASALPDNRRILVAEPGSIQTFSALVRSSEDAGESIKVRLYINYGVERGDKPWSSFLTARELAPATGEEDRLASATWTVPELPLGCYTATLIVSHAFDEVSQCPEYLVDSSQLTWLVNVCVPGACDSLDLQTCPEVTDACPDVADAAGTSTGASP